ncbi:hypothetical protein [Alicyclobacillus kakegawensis]|uniref:hypothetical protein n=1 Tax=Alicyclobacillus kakegawensis TaxID=392012 RepID=UPI00082F1E28|nr:hypothetical protein [Alicyclobacillus kakegawensis]
MKLASASVEVVRLSLSTTFRTAVRQADTISDIRVVLRTDTGLVGLGSASPTPAITGETTASICSVIEDFILPRLKRLDLSDEAAARAEVQQAIVHNSSAKAAVDIALHDLYAKQLGLPLAKRLGNAGHSPETDFVKKSLITGGIDYDGPVIKLPEGLGLGVSISNAEGVHGG